MKRLLVSLVLLFSFSAFSEECIRALPTPIVDPKHSTVSTYSVKHNSGLELVEYVELKTGLMFSISHFGCAHFSLSYEFSMMEELELGMISQAIAYLSEVVSVAPIHTKFIIEHLSSLPDDYETPDEIVITPGYDWIFLKVNNTRKERKFSITYDIAL